MITEELKNKIIEEVKILKDIDDCTGIKISNDRGIFIQVTDDSIDGKLYFVELNDVDESDNNCDGWYPIKGCIAYASLGDMEELIEVIEMLEDIEERTLKENL